MATMSATRGSAHQNPRKRLAAQTDQDGEELRDGGNLGVTASVQLGDPQLEIPNSDQAGNDPEEPAQPCFRDSPLKTGPAVARPHLGAIAPPCVVCNT